MQKKKISVNTTTVKTYTQFLIFTPFPVIILTFPLLCWVLKSVVSFWWWRSGMLWWAVSIWSWSLQEIWCSRWWLLLSPSRICIGSFYTFANMLLHLVLASLVCSSTLQPNLLHTVAFMFVKYCFLVPFVIPKSRFVPLQVCISVPGYWWVVYSCGVTSTKPASLLLPLRAHAQVPCVLCHHFSVTPRLRFSMLQHYARVVKL